MLKKKYVIIAILIFIVLIGLFSAIAGKNNKSLRTIDYILTDSEKTQGVADNEASAEGDKKISSTRLLDNSSPELDDSNDETDEKNNSAQQQDISTPESDDSKGETDRIIRSKQPHDFRVPAWSDPEGAVDKTISANTDDISDKIPVYYEKELLLENSRAFDLGGDAAIFDPFNIRPNHPGVILTVYPTDAIRERDNNSLYFIYDTDTGYRLFLYFKKNENNTIILQGYPVVVKELLSYSDFESIKTGDSIKAVEDIDSTAELYEKHYIEVWNMDYKAVENHNKLGDPCVSIHYLTDGILKIRYDMTEDNELIVAETEFSEDYTFIDRRGDKVNYKIEEVDLPIQK